MGHSTSISSCLSHSPLCCARYWHTECCSVLINLQCEICLWNFVLSLNWHMSFLPSCYRSTVGKDDQLYFWSVAPCPNIVVFLWKPQPFLDLLLLVEWLAKLTAKEQFSFASLVFPSLCSAGYLLSLSHVIQHDANAGGGGDRGLLFYHLQWLVSLRQFQLHVMRCDVSNAGLGSICVTACFPGVLILVCRRKTCVSLWCFILSGTIIINSYLGLRSSWLVPPSICMPTRPCVICDPCRKIGGKFQQEDFLNGCQHRTISVKWWNGQAFVLLATSHLRRWHLPHTRPPIWFLAALRTINGTKQIFRRIRWIERRWFLSSCNSDHHCIGIGALV